MKKSEDILLDLFNNFKSKYPYKPWIRDNIGILIPFPEPISITTISKSKREVKIVICSDLKESTLEEFEDPTAINILITYHPIIFMPKKKVPDLFVKLILKRVAVISIHTIVDRVVNKRFIEKVLNQKLDDDFGSEVLNEEGLTCIIENKLDNKTILERVKHITNSKKLVTSIDSGKKYDYLLIGVGSCSFNDDEIYKRYFKPKNNYDFTKIENTLIVSGEMSYHSILRHRKKNSGVILCGHYESENWYLKELKKVVEEFLGDKNLSYEISVRNEDGIVDFY